MKCFEKSNVPPGYTPVDGSKCHATEAECAESCGPCWRCYGKNFGCDDLSFEVEYVGFQDMDEFLTVDTTEEKGLPIGTTFGPFQQTDSLPDMTQLDFLYVSEDKTSTQFGGRLTCNQPGDETVLKWSWFTVGVVGGKPKVLLQFDNSFINYAKDGYVDFAPSLEIQKAPGEYPVFGVIKSRRNDGDIESVGKVQILVRVFDMNNAVPSEYQCFENPPTEEGWIATGDCHKTEEECKLTCGLRCSDPCSVVGHNAGYLLNDQMLSNFFQYGDDIESLNLEVNGVRQAPFFVEFTSNNQLRAYISSFSNPASLYDANLNLNISPYDPIYDCSNNYGYISFINADIDYTKKSRLIFSFNNFFGGEFVANKVESAQFSVYGPNENFGFYENVLYLQEVSFGGITWTNPYPPPPDLLTPTVVTFYDSTWCDPTNRTPVAGYTPEELVEVPVKSFSGPISGKYSVYKADGTLLRRDSFSLQWPELLSVHDCPPCNTPGGRTMSTTTKTTGGPGTELSKLLKMIGINAKEKGCGCRSHAKRMDREGPQWCRDNIETVLGWLQTEAKKRQLPFVKAAAKQVVLLAIRRAEKK